VRPIFSTLDPFRELYTSMRTLVLQFLTAATATCMITFTVTHMHMDEFYIQWTLWFWHWAVAIPIAFCTVRWIAPIYKRIIDRF
jgi:hypothetical protein